jgi:methyl-accepting chemotaxis protein
MNTWNNLKVGYRLIIGFLAVAVIAAIIGVVGLNGLSSVSHAAVKGDDANRVVKSILEIRRAEKNFIERKDTKYISDIHSILDDLDRQAAVMRETAGAEESALINQVVDGVSQYRRNLESYVAGYNETVTESDNMVAAAHLAETEAADLRTSQKEQLDKELAALALGQITQAKVEERILKADAANRLIKYMQDLRVTEKNFMLRTESQYVNEFNSILAEALAQVAATRATMNQQVNLDQMDRMHTALTAYGGHVASYVSLYEQMDANLAEMVESARYVQGNRETGNAYYGGADLLREYAKEQGEAAQATATATAIAVMIAGVIIAIGLALVIQRGITGPVAKVARVAEAISQGDIDTEIDVNTKDELGQLAGSMRNASSYMRTMAAAAGKMADGDLTIEVNAKSEKDVLGNAFVQMISNLRVLIIGIQDKASNLGESSKQLSEAANQTGQAVQQVSSTAQQMATGAQEQAQNLTQIAAGMGNVGEAVNSVATSSQEQTQLVTRASDVISRVSSGVEQVAGGAQSAAEGVDTASETTRHGDEMTRKTSEAMTGIKDSISVLSDKVNEMNERATQIGKIVATIDDVASQTNLLALNANIEAARAGEHGRGFAVVADEVRKLAERTALATKETADLIGDMQKSVAEAVEAVSDGSGKAADGAQLSEETAEALKTVLDEVEKVQEQVKQISTAATDMAAANTEMVKTVDNISTGAEQNAAAAEEMTASTNEIVKSVETTAGIAEESSAATEEMSASAEEMNAQVEEIVALSGSLSDMAGDLQQSVSQFKAERRDNE